MLKNQIFFKFTLLVLVSLFLIFPQDTLANDSGKRQLSVIKDQHPSGFRKLSDSPTQIEPHYEYAIIGSGYGASVMALRIVEAIRSDKEKSNTEKVAIFERGREWLPGDFPENPVEMAKSLRTPLNPLGLVNIETHQTRADMEIISSNALAGTSNMNIAINLRPPVNVWQQKQWPKEIRKAFEDGEIEKNFQIVEQMLRPNHGPITRSVPKSANHLANLREDGIPTGELNLAINHEQGREQYGVKQNACTYCGNCAAGCNVGAKNTLATNYLAKAKGETPDGRLKIFTQMEITHFEKINEPDQPRYRVYYTYHFQNEKSDLGIGVLHKDLRTFKQIQSSFTTNNLVIGAGSTGSTQLLMHSAQKGFPLSKALGSRVSANGDLMGFVYNSKIQTNIAAYEDTKRTKLGNSPVGQTITVYGDYRQLNQDRPLDEQFVLLDGAIPAALSPTISKSLATVMGSSSALSLSGMRRIGRDLISPYPTAEGALNHSMLLLACGHDSSSGRYELDSNGNIYAVWPEMKKEVSFQYIEQEMKKYAARMGGVYIPNPRAQSYGGGKMPVPHPLGGAPMGESVETGVVNHLGQVFNPQGGVHEGLYVVDASIIPRSLAAPPLLTISAIAERIAKNFVEQIFESSCEKTLKK